jgi:hypothetical protein
MISDLYFDFDTYDLIYLTLNSEDLEYIKNNNVNISIYIFKRWKSIVNSLSSNYYLQYYSKSTPIDRNNWFKKYLDYPTKDISQMPEVL